MEEKDLLENLPQKVQKMYSAVAEMVNEGQDVNTMKVSDITKRAGIGKGTAYEYFSSKEEIIARALLYDVKEKLGVVEEIVDSPETFEQKVLEILDFIADKFSQSQTFCTLVRMMTGSYEISEALRREYENLDDRLSCGQLEGLVDLVMEQGAKEGVICEPDLLFRRVAFGSQMLAFAAYLVTRYRGCENGKTKAQMKAFAYKSLVKVLNT